MLAQIALNEDNLDVALDLWKKVADFFANTDRGSEARTKCALLGVKKAQLLAQNSDQKQISQLLLDVQTALEA